MGKITGGARKSKIDKDGYVVYYGLILDGYYKGPTLDELEKLVENEPILTVLVEEESMEDEKGEGSGVRKTVCLLNERVILVDLDIGMWDGSVRDLSIEAKVEQQYQAPVGVGPRQALGKYHKSLIVSPKLDRVISKGGEMRRVHIALTQPWSQGGDRLLASRAIEKYQDTLRPLRLEFDSFVEDLLVEYPALVEARCKQWDQVFKEKEFPSPDDLRKRYYVNFKFAPVPTAGDFRIDIASEQLEAMKHQFAEDQAKQLAGAVEALWETCRKMVSASRDKLNGYKVGVGRGGSRMHDSVLEGLLELAERLPLLNVNDDPRLETFAKELKEAVEGESVEELKKDEALRKAMAKKLEGVLGVMGAHVEEK